MQWKDVDCPTFTWISKLAINWLDYGNSFSGIQTDCLWQTICILERQLLVSITQNKNSSYSMSSSKKQWRKLSHRSLWLFHDNAPAHKSLVAQQALNREFVQLNHPAYSLDLAPSNCFLIRNLKYHLCRTWFIDNESLKIAVKSWSESLKNKVYFQGINSWEQKWKIRIDVAREYVKNDSMRNIICWLFYMPSVLWQCWLGDRKGIRPVKNWVVGCWHGYLSGVRCRLAYGPADATATHCL